jgi:hypothetical protein
MLKHCRSGWRYSYSDLCKPYRFFRLLYKYGASNVINIKDEGLKSFSAKAYAQAVK